MEVTQFTYFQQVGGIDCSPVLGEITYGIERLAMYLQGVENVYDLVGQNLDGNIVTYGDVLSSKRSRTIHLQLRIQRCRLALAPIQRL